MNTQIKIAFVMFLFINVSYSMEKQIHSFQTQKWPDQSAKVFQEKISFIVSHTEHNKKFPLFKAINDYLQNDNNLLGTTNDLSGIKAAWQECQQLGNNITIGGRQFDSQTVLTAALYLCKGSCNRNSRVACYLAESCSYPLFTCIKIGWTNGLLQALAHPFSVGWQDVDFTAFLKVCIAKGIPINIKNPEGRLPLHYAAWCRTLEDVKLLCAEPEWILEKDKDGKSPCDYARMNGRYRYKKSNPILEFFVQELQSVWDND